MKVSIEISEATNGNFSDLILSYSDSGNITNKVSLNIRNFINVYDFIDEAKSVEFDFFFNLRVSVWGR